MLRNRQLTIPPNVIGKHKNPNPPEALKTKEPKSGKIFHYGKKTRIERAAQPGSFFFSADKSRSEKTPELKKRSPKFEKQSQKDISGPVFCTYPTEKIFVHPNGKRKKRTAKSE